MSNITLDDWDYYNLNTTKSPTTITKDRNKDRFPLNCLRCDEKFMSIDRKFNRVCSKCWNVNVAQAEEDRNALA